MSSHLKIKIKQQQKCRKDEHNSDSIEAATSLASLAESFCLQQSSAEKHTSEGSQEKDTTITTAATASTINENLGKEEGRSVTKKKISTKTSTAQEIPNEININTDKISNSNTVTTVTLAAATTKPKQQLLLPLRTRNRKRMTESKDVHEDSKEKSERKRQREKQRRSELTTAFDEMHSFILRLDAGGGAAAVATTIAEDNHGCEDNPDGSSSNSPRPAKKGRRLSSRSSEVGDDAGMTTRVDLINRALVIMKNLHRENMEMRQALARGAGRGPREKNEVMVMVPTLTPADDGPSAPAPGFLRPPYLPPGFAPLPPQPGQHVPQGPPSMYGPPRGYHPIPPGGHVWGSYPPGNGSMPPGCYESNGGEPHREVRGPPPPSPSIMHENRR